MVHEIVEKILANAARQNSYVKSTTDEAARREYNANFEGEGQRKIRFVVADLDDLKRRGFNAAHAVALSIGGSDGSDLRALMSQTGIRGGVLLEYDNDAAERARKKSPPLKVITGDATQQLDAALRAAKELVPAADTLIVLCFGVLHELPTRSPGFDFDHFFDLLFGAGFPSVLVYCAKSCAQNGNAGGWPKQVEIGIPSVPASKLADVAEVVRNYPFRDLRVAAPTVCTEPHVRMGGNLAVEVLHKVLRFNSVERYFHEMEERQHVV